MDIRTIAMIKIRGCQTCDPYPPYPWIWICPQTEGISISTASPYDISHFLTP